MPRIPLSARRIMFEQRTTEDQVLLVTISHPELAAPIRLSSDATEKLSLEPLVFGIKSNGLEYQLVLMSAILPDNRRGSPRRAALTFQDIDSTHIELVRSFINPATVDLEVVFASAPDVVTDSYEGLRMKQVSYDESSSSMTIEFSRELYLSEPLPSHRQTKNVSPGLHGIPSA